MSLAGLFSGLAMPSRDMIVRSVTPPGAFGRVFGFVSTGFNIAGIMSPMIFGQLLDRGHPRADLLLHGRLRAARDDRCTGDRLVTTGGTKPTVINDLTEFL